MIGASGRPTTLGDLRATSLQAGGLFGAPPIVQPPYTLSTGGGVRAPAGFILLSETDPDGTTYYLTETIDGVPYYMMEAA